MSKFKVGDYVRDNIEPEDVLVVTGVGVDYVNVVDIFGNGNTYHPDDLTLSLFKLDVVNQPSHYKTTSGFEVLDLIEDEPFSRASIIKYVFRAGKKDGADELQDLRKAEHLIQREIRRVASNQAVTTNEEN